ncbi:MAG: hypothetical protein WEB03_11435 [Nitriliruptor sp.]|uniref:hypothetical protein n=1 Tax=Nitriliruptor sp. TaxID=2448056 RepID=UPI0034A0327F
MGRETLLVLVLATVWWAPTMFAVRELHDRQGDRRVLVWRWTAIITLPLIGPVLWYVRGRKAMDEDAGRRVRRR